MNVRRMGSPRALWPRPRPIERLALRVMTSGKRLNALALLLGAELLQVLTLADLDRADAIGSYWGNP
jgi:hypothetical protein